MPSLKNIRTQIASKKSTQKITRAMKLVAASRLRRAQDAIVAARPYANALAEAVAEVALRAGGESHPLLERRGPERITLVLLTSDRGLAGGFNANIFRVAQKFIAERKAAMPPAREIVLEIVGKKGRDYYRRRRQTITRETPAPTAESASQIADEIAQIVSHEFRDSRTDAVFLVYNEFKSAVQQRVVVEPLLPVSTELAGAAQHGGGTLDFAYEPSKEKLLDTLLPLYLESQIYRALLESIASELGARMTAMDNATNNAKEMIANLTLQYNRARQAAITKELMEIVSGAEALKG
ncbi:MAG TPA: ATP synthase F1 subunit gamma [Polyangia bacterium]|jgi:F-type H+-transporting ATPase subunit gamma|nr:ATP synthase F1 subunit gamma [Polyangia bacterium]